MSATGAMHAMGIALVASVVAAMACAPGPDATRQAARRGEVRAWVTTSDRARLLDPDTVTIVDPGGVAVAGETRIDVDTSVAFQEMVGFGASITDASAWLIQTRMAPGEREALLQELFGAAGLGLSFARLTVGASDFSRTHYTFDDVAPGERDPGVAHFSIAPNREAVIPVVQRARSINPSLTLMATPWSAPAWMKDKGSLIGGTLRGDAHGSFAEYLARYVEAYADERIPIFALTLQNEPHHEPDDYPGMRLTPAQRITLVRDHVGPLFARRGLRTALLEWDHNWDEPGSPLAVLADSGARRHVAGVAWHCYAGDVAVQGAVHDAHTDKDVYFTECSGGEWAPDWGDNLAWNVRMLLIGATRGWARGVLFWNLALDERHGPHTGGCSNCRGVVTIDSRTGEVTRNVEYYVLAHASRFVRPRARRVESTTGVDGVESVAFRNADGTTALIVLNGGETARRVVVQEGAVTFAYPLPKGAVATFTWD